MKTKKHEKMIYMNALGNLNFKAIKASGLNT